MAEPTVTGHYPLNLQICVPREYTDAQAKAFANKACLCGTQYGWHVRKEGADYPEFKQCVTCDKHPENVHILLDA